MKIVQLLFSLLFLSVAFAEEAEVNVQGDVKAPEPDCEQQCREKVNAALAALSQQKQGLQNDLTRIQKELEDQKKANEGLKNNFDGQTKEKDGLLKEIEQLRKSLEESRKKLEQADTKAGEREKAVADAKRELSQAKSKAAKLEKDLAAANEEIKELAGISFVSQLRKEILALWASMVGFIQKLLAKKEQNDTK